jgi:hypothetical protein
MKLFKELKTTMFEKRKSNTINCLSNGGVECKSRNKTKLEKEPTENIIKKIKLKDT